MKQDIYSPHGHWIIAVTVFSALVLTVWPVPAWAGLFRPAWVALVVIYWCMALPERVGIGIAWGIGVLIDALTGSLLGEHALALALIAFLVLRWHLQLRIYPLWQQTLAVTMLLMLYEFIPFWIDGAVGYTNPAEARWLPIVSSMILWPWVLHALRYLRRRYRVR
jgi:rod shape-determining protein MreD